MADEFTIRDVAEMIASIQIIEKTVNENKELLTALNGCVDAVTIDVAVLKFYQETHGITHEELNTRINRIGAGNVGLTAALTTIAAILGVQK